MSYHWQRIDTGPGGYAIDLERHDLLEQDASVLAYSASEGDLRLQVSPMYTKVENQGRQGACRGHSGSTCLETLWVRQLGDYRQFSRAQMYYETQRLDRISGDRGSTIHGGCQLLTDTGLVLESDWPYPTHYNPARPPGYELMEKVRISGYTEIHTYEQAWQHLSEYGPLDWGIAWTSDWDRQAADGGLITTYSGGRGGHALALIGLSVVDFDGKPLPGDGRPWILQVNSWDIRWGHKGQSLISPECMEMVLAHRQTACVGYFEIEEPEIPKPEAEPI